MFEIATCPDQDPPRHDPSTVIDQIIKWPDQYLKSSSPRVKIEVRTHFAI